jgi:polyisoprenoid-binding protein YceI
MKKLLQFITILALPFVVSAQTKTNLDIKSSIIAWEGKKVGGSHDGNVSLKSGNLIVSDSKVIGGEFVIDMNSITCKDIENADYNAKLVAHLKNEDFFNTAKFPTATLKITKVAKAKNTKISSHVITADLTIKGITKSIKFPANLKVVNGKVTATASFTVDRSLFDIRYGSETFFGSLGDKAIKNEMYFTVSLVGL